MRHRLLLLSFGPLLLCSLALAALAADDPRAALFAAVRNTDVAAIKAALDQGADVNAKHETGISAIWIAASKGKPEIVELLLSRGADPNSRDREGRNALMLMSMESRRDKDIELTIEDREKIEPKLRYRRRDRAVELIGETLLNAGCDVNAADNKGRTPLMYAAIFERPSAVNLLLKRGANINARDQNGQSALDWAKKSGNEEIIRMLSLR